MKVLLSEVNISEGKNLDLINLVKAELMKDKNLQLIDLNSDKDHNRTVFTYLGEPEAVLEGTKRLAAKAIELIDMTSQKGSHPRIGAVDVVPFIPARNVTTEEAVSISKRFAKFLGELGVPVYYYEDAQDNPDRKNLVKIRKGEYEGLEEKMKDLDWIPDEGPKTFNPKSGATVTGSRFPLIAFNINLNTEDLEIGKNIVKAIRGATGGYQHVRSIALEIPQRKMIQVSINLTNYEKTPIHRVFETVKSELNRCNITISDTEFVGPVPLAAIQDVLKFYVKVNDSFSIDQIY